MISAMHAVSGPGHSFVVRRATIRAFVLPATLAIAALLSLPQASAAAGAKIDANPQQSSSSAHPLGGNVVIAGSLNPSAARPQSLTAQSISFGGTNIGQTSSIQTQVFSFSSDITLGSVLVLTQGAPNLDFQRATSETGSTVCKAGTSYSSGQTCSVEVTFTPQTPGLRMGAVVLEDNSTPANVVATAYVFGIGQGPGVAFTPGVVSTIAGSTGTHPVGIAVDAAGNLYIADALDQIVRKVTSGGTVSTVAGGGTGCSGQTDSFGDGCPATSAILNNPQDVAIDGAGNIYIADSNAQSSTLRKIGLDGTITRIAGSGSGCVGQTDGIGDGCPATDSTLFVPLSVAVNGSGVLYIADRNDLVVRQIASTGIITAVFSTQYVTDEPVSVAVDGFGNLYIAVNGPGVGGSTLYKMPLSTGAPTAVATADQFGTIAVDGAEDIYFSDIDFSAIRKVSLDGTISLISIGSLHPDSGVAVDGTGNLYIADPISNLVGKVDVTSTPALTFAVTPVGATSTDSPQTVTVSNIGNQSLVFSAPSKGGSNPSYPESFPENIKASSLCDAGTPLSAGASCSVSANFTPTTTGSLQGSIVLTDNALNATSATQTISLSGMAQPAGTVTINTSPQGLQVSVDGGAAQSAPFTVNWQAGTQHTLSAISPQDAAGAQYSFDSWSDSGAATHTVTASASTYIYTATFLPSAFLLTTS